MSVAHLDDCKQNPNVENTICIPQSLNVLCQKLQNAFQIPSGKFISSIQVYPEMTEHTKLCEFQFEALHHRDIMLLSKVQQHYPFQLAVDFIFHNGPNYKNPIPASGKKQFAKVIAS